MQTNKIAELNDKLRQNIFTPTEYGTVIITNGVSILPIQEQIIIMNLVKNFNKFTAGNDPYAEHDFGKVSLNGIDYFFKIDYYDNDLTYGSENPSDNSITKRVLTIMRADEY